MPIPSYSADRDVSVVVDLNCIRIPTPTLRRRVDFLGLYTIWDVYFAISLSATGDVDSRPIVLLA
jgi:hypothetical protein